MGAENFAWSITFLFMPLTCVYYPVATLPAWLQPVAWLLPPTYVFEGMRALIIDKVFRPDLMVEAVALNEVVREVLELVAPRAKELGVQLEASLSDKLPEV